MEKNLIAKSGNTQRAAQVHRGRRKPTETGRKQTETERAHTEMRRNDTQRAAQTHRQLAETHKDGAHTHRDAAQGHTNGAQRWRTTFKERELQNTNLRHRANTKNGPQCSDTAQTQRMDQGAGRRSHSAGEKKESKV